MLNADILGVKLDKCTLNGEFRVLFTSPELSFKRQWRCMVTSTYVPYIQHD